MIRIQRERTYGGNHIHGFGVMVEYGSLGTAYGDPRRNLHASVVLWLWWGVSVLVTWKALPPKEEQ